jgi:hypothetical protein
MKMQFRHVFGVPSLIITGFELDDWIYWRLLLQSLLITIIYNSSQAMTAQDSLHSDWTTTGFSFNLSSTMTDLVLIYDSFTSASRIISEGRRTNHLKMNSFLVLLPTATLRVRLNAFLSERPLIESSGIHGSVCWMFFYTKTRFVLSRFLETSYMSQYIWQYHCVYRKQMVAQHCVGLSSLYEKRSQH